MGKKVRYQNGIEGFASDKVAKILEEKGAAKIIGDVKPEAPEAKKDKAEK